MKRPKREAEDGRKRVGIWVRVSTEEQAEGGEQGEAGREDEPGVHHLALVPRVQRAASS